MKYYHQKGGLKMTDHLDLIIKGHLLTMSHSLPLAQAVGVKNGRITAVGTEAEINKLVGNKTEIWDMNGKTVLPGFIDTHVHGVMTGNLALNVDLSKAASIDDICRMLRQKAETTPLGKPVIGMNFNYEVIKEGRMPTLAELDRITIDHPVIILLYDCHSAMLNTPALKLIRIPEKTEGIILDGNGKLTGLIEDPASTHVLQFIAPTEKLSVMKSVQTTIDEALKVGITTLHIKEAPDVLKIILANEDKISIRLTPLALITEKSGLEFVLNDHMLSNRAVVAIIADGAPDSKTAALFEPYKDDPSNYGILLYSDKDLEEVITIAHKAGSQISVHTCGTRAIEQAISIYEKVLEAYSRDDHRHRIEHFELPLGDHIKRIVAKGITLAIQPTFLFYAGEETFNGYARVLGKEAAERWTPLRGILDHGGLIAGGSDSPVTPMHPLAGIHASVNHPIEKHRITLYEAIRMFTADAAKIGFEENSKGKIEVGQLADFVILSANPFQTPINQISTIHVEKTIIGGKIMYQRSQA